MVCISFVIYLVGYRGYVYNCVYIYIHVSELYTNIIEYQSEIKERSTGNIRFLMDLMGDTLWLVAIAMENSPFIDDL